LGHGDPSISYCGDEGDIVSKSLPGIPVCRRCVLLRSRREVYSRGGDCITRIPGVTIAHDPDGRRYWHDWQRWVRGETDVAPQPWRLGS
jgi:hypothetical protein